MKLSVSFSVTGPPKVRITQEFVSLGIARIDGGTIDPVPAPDGESTNPETPKVPVSHEPFMEPPAPKSIPKIRVVHGSRYSIVDPDYVARKKKILK